MDTHTSNGNPGFRHSLENLPSRHLVAPGRTRRRIRPAGPSPVGWGLARPRVRRLGHRRWPGAADHPTHTSGQVLVSAHTRTGVVVAIDGTSGSGKSSTSRGVADAARAALPRHRRDVPRDDLVDAAPRRRRARPGRVAARCGEPRDRVAAPTRSAPTITVDGVDVAAAIRTARGQRRGLAGQRGPRGAGPAARAAARGHRAAGGIVVEGRDIGSVVGAGRRREGLPHRRPGRAGRPPGRRGGRLRPRGDRGVAAGPRPDRLRPRRSRRWSWPRTRSTSTPRRTPSTRSSTWSSRWSRPRSERVTTPDAECRHPPTCLLYHGWPSGEPVR